MSLGNFQTLKNLRFCLKSEIILHFPLIFITHSVYNTTGFPESEKNKRERSMKKLPYIYQGYVSENLIVMVSDSIPFLMLKCMLRKSRKE